jgi:glycosyltransferase involved in cell wall biosynthesis
MNKISYCVSVCTERVEVQLLLEQLFRFKRDIDEILVLFDEKNGSNEVREYLETIENITLIRADFNNDFATFKNKFANYATGDYIIQLDADEVPHHLLLAYLPDILDGNPNIDLFWIPRINTVKNIGLSQIQEWGWNVSKLDNYIEEKEFNLDNPQDLDEYRLLQKYKLIIEEKY